MTMTNLTLTGAQRTIVKSALDDKMALYRRFRGTMSNVAQGVEYIDSQIETIADLIEQLSTNQ